MISNQLKELESARAKVAELEQAIATGLAEELRALPARYGFENADAFASAVKAASGGKPGRPRSAPAAPAQRKGKRKRAKITDETRAEVKKLVQVEKTGAEIAKTLGISLPSVQNIKRDLGLVRKIKK